MLLQLAFYSYRSEDWSVWNSGKRTRLHIDLTYRVLWGTCFQDQRPVREGMKIVLKECGQKGPKRIEKLYIIGLGQGRRGVMQERDEEAERSKRKKQIRRWGWTMLNVGSICLRDSINILAVNCTLGKCIFVTTLNEWTFRNYSCSGRVIASEIFEALYAYIWEWSELTIYLRNRLCWYKK